MAVRTVHGFDAIGTCKLPGKLDSFKLLGKLLAKILKKQRLRRPQRLLQRGNLVFQPGNFLIFRQHFLGVFFAKSPRNLLVVDKGAQDGNDAHRDGEWNQILLHSKAHYQVICAHQRKFSLKWHISGR